MEVPHLIHLRRLVVLPIYQFPLPPQNKDNRFSIPVGNLLPPQNKDNRFSIYFVESMK